MSESTNGVNDLEPFVELLKKLGRRDLSKEVLDTFSKLAFTIDQYDNLAKCYFNMKYYDKAAEFAEKALALAKDPQTMFNVRKNLVNVYNHANLPEEALKTIRLCEAYYSDNDLDLEKSYSNFLLNRKDEAERLLRISLEKLDPNDVEARTKIMFNLGTYHLYRDEFLTGITLFLKEGAKLKFWNVENIFARSDSLTASLLSSRYKEWDGEIHPGATVICHAEAGIGDEIINVRFLKLIEERGMNPVWYSDIPQRKDLEDVFRRNGVRVITDLNEVKNDAEVYYIFSMHIPVALKLEYKDLWHGPYIKADTAHVEKWSKILNKLNGRKKIAIRWQGNPEYDQDLHRSVPLKDIYEAVKDIDADFYSLQLGNGLEELPDFPGLVDLTDHIKTWDDTFAAMENFDIVITSCTSVVHAAGACGARTIALIPISAYYTWSHSMKQSPWYGDNVSICRQSKARSWTEPLAELTNLLKNSIDTNS